MSAVKLHYQWIYHTLTTVCLVSSTINRSSLTTPGPVLPPNSAALLSPTGVRVKSLHGGRGCPMTLGELHSPRVDDIIPYLRLLPSVVPTITALNNTMQYVQQKMIIS